MRDFRGQCQRFMATKGWARVEQLALEDGPFAFAAIQLIANYAFGKPTQPIEQSGTLTVEHVDSRTVDDALDYAAQRRRLRAVS